jgi:hypothetical protein
MTPLSFEWTWSMDYFIFMGFLYLALIVVGCGLAYTYLKSWFDIQQEKEKLPPDISQRSDYSKY